MTKSASKEIEDVYAHLITRTSSFEKLIVRDLTRTFPKLEYFQKQENQQALYNVVKAYSLYDPEVGYCQGISFIVGPLLLNVQLTTCIDIRCLKNKHFVCLLSL